MADPIFYYQVTLVNGAQSEPYVVPWVTSLDANPQNEVVVLQSSLGSYVPGLYVGSNGGWKLAIPYEPITQAIINGAGITVIYNSTEDVDYGGSQTTTSVFVNGLPINGTVVDAVLNGFYGVIQSFDVAAGVYSVNGVDPDASGNVELQITDIPDLAPELASAVWTVNGVGVDSNHNVNVYLRNLPDVSISEGPAIDGYLLRFSNSISQWVAESPSALDIIHSVNGQTGGSTGAVVVQALPAETTSSTSLSLVSDSGATTGNILIKNLVSTGDITLTDNGTDIALSIPSYVQAVQSSPEAGGTTLVANDGSVTQVAQIKELVAGANVNFATDGNSVTINATNNTGGGGNLTAVQSTGSGTSLVNYDGSGGTTIALLKSISAGANITITQDVGLDTITIAAASITPPVTSVNGQTGAVVITASDITGLATVATTGNYDDLINTPTPYVLPIASSQTLGGIKVGSNLTIAGDGTLSANALQLNPATTTTLGGVIVGSGLTVQSDGTLAVVPYTLAAATTSSLGGIIVGPTLSVQGNGQLDYDLPPATDSTLGGVIAGSGIAITDDGVISTTPLVIATTTTLGGVIVPPSGGLVVDGSGNLSINDTDVVTSINTTAGAVTIAEGTGVTVTTSGSTITIAASGATGGTVTEVGLAMPPIFTVSGSPVTTTGTLTATLNSQNANLIWAGPTTGSANQPTFRSLVGGDLPAATTSANGAVKPGSGLAITVGGTLSVDPTQVITSFNGRIGAVTLQLSDIVNLGAVIAGNNNTLSGNNNYTGTNSFTGGTITVPTVATSDDSNNAASTAYVQEVIATLATGVTSFNTRTGAVVFQAADVTGVGGALLASPAFTGTPTAPTPSTSTNNTSLATTAYVQNNLVSYAPLNSPALTGTPTAPTATAGTNTTQLATTAFVQAAITTNAGVTTFNGRNGAVTLNSTDITGAGGALLNSPAFTGVPTSTTPSTGDNTTKIATTAFVQASLSSGAVTSFNTRIGVVTLTLADVTGAGGAPLASPSFTGVPVAPTASPGTNTTQIATTAFVTTAVASGGVQPATTTTLGGVIIGSGLTVQTSGLLSANVTTVAGRTGAVTLSVTDISGAAPLASPAFTGTPTAPTASVGTDTTQLATTGFVQNTLAASISVTVSSSNISLGTNANYNTVIFVGNLTANVIVTLPFPGQWIFYNETTNAGSFTLTLSNGVTSGATFVLQEGSSVHLFSDTNLGVLPAITSGITTASLDNSNNLATTSFVHTLLGSGSNVVNSFNTRVGVVTLQASDVTGVGGALLASPAFTGTPTAPTAANGTSTTQLATTAFVVGTTLTGSTTVSLAGGSSSLNLTTAELSFPVIYFTGALTASIAVTIPITGQWTFHNSTTGSTSFTLTLGNGGTATYVLAQGTSIQVLSNLTLGVIPSTGTAVTQSPTDNSTNIATTAYVQDVLGLGTGVVTSFNTRSGAVTLVSGDITGAGGALVASANTWTAANSFTGGSITVPTAAEGTSSTAAASTAFVSNAMLNTTTINVSGLTSPYTVPASQYGTTVIELTGSLTANLTLTLPTSGIWSFYNNTTSSGGTFNVTLSNGSGATYVALDNESSSVISLGTLGIVNSNISAFTLTPATSTTLGGVIVPNGSGLTVNSSGDIAVSAATGSTAGIVSQGTGVTISGTGVLSANVVSVFGRTGSVVLTLADVTGVGGAPAASPTFTGTVVAPTPTIGVNNTDVATTAYVYAATQGTAVISLTGGATTLVLTAAQYSAEILEFTGTLTANIIITMPGSGAWEVLNLCTGAFTVTLGNGAGQNLVIPQATENTLPVVANSTAGMVTIAGGGSTVVNTFNTRSGTVTLTNTDISGAGGALVASPVFTGTPQAPTAAAGDNSVQIATDAYVYRATQGSATVALAAANVTLSAAQYSVPVIIFTGTLTANVTVTVPTSGQWIFYNATSGAFSVTLSNGTGATAVVPQSGTATSPYISDGSAGVLPVNPIITGVSSVNGSTGAVTGIATLASPTFTGVPAAPTATAGTSTTQVATTAFVATSFAPLANPALTGVPTAPTATTGTNTTQLATTAFVQAATTGTYAPLASPAFTGTPTAPTASTGTDTTQLATTAFVYNADQGSSSVALTGSNVTLTATQYSVPVIIFTGTLTASVVVTVPTVGSWTVYNTTTNTSTNAFTVTLTNGSGAGLVLPQSVVLATETVATSVISNTVGVIAVQPAALTRRLQTTSQSYAIDNIGSTSGTLTLDLGLYSEFAFTVSAATTIAFTNTLGTSTGQVVYLRITNGGTNITWPTGSLYSGGTAPTLSASGIDMIGVKYDAISAVYMIFTLGLAMAT